MTTATLQSIFQASPLDTTITPQGHLTVSNGRTAYVFPVLDGKMLQLTAVASARPDSTEQSRLSFANRVHEQLYNVRVRVASSGQISFDAFIPIHGGTTRDAMVRATEHFLSTVSQAASLDNERVLG
jgi:hypothetical protein